MKVPQMWASTGPVIVSPILKNNHIRVLWLDVKVPLWDQIWIVTRLNRWINWSCIIHLERKATSMSGTWPDPCIHREHPWLYRRPPEDSVLIFARACKDPGSLQLHVHLWNQPDFPSLWHPVGKRVFWKELREKDNGSFSLTLRLL